VQCELASNACRSPKNALLAEAKSTCTDLQQSRNEAQTELATVRQDMEEALQHVESAKKERDIARDLAASLLKEQADLKQQLQDQPLAQPEVSRLSMGVIAYDCLAFPAPKTHVIC